MPVNNKVMPLQFMFIIYTMCCMRTREFIFINELTRALKINTKQFIFLLMISKRDRKLSHDKNKNRITLSYFFIVVAISVY